MSARAATQAVQFLWLEVLWLPTFLKCSPIDILPGFAWLLPLRRVMVKKTLLQWHWALEGPAANFDGEIATCTLEVGMTRDDGDKLQ